MKSHSPFPLHYEIMPATLKDYPLIQNLARFYVYDLSRECGLHYPGWECPADGLFECDNFKSYFEQADRKPYLIKINQEIAGFVLVQTFSIIPGTDFNMGEFFVIAKFQKTGMAQKIAIDIFSRFKGKWSVGVIPENKRALHFWKKTISSFTNNQFQEQYKTSAELITVEHPDPFPMIFFTFSSRST